MREKTSSGKVAAVWRDKVKKNKKIGKKDSPGELMLENYATPRSIIFAKSVTCFDRFTNQNAIEMARSAIFQENLTCQVEYLFRVVNERWGKRDLANVINHNTPSRTYRVHIVRSGTFINSSGIYCIAIDSIICCGVLYTPKAKCD